MKLIAIFLSVALSACCDSGTTKGLGEEFIVAAVARNPAMQIHHTNNGPQAIDQSFPGYQRVVSAIDSSSIPVFLDTYPKAPSSTRFFGLGIPGYITISVRDLSRDVDRDDYLLGTFDSLWIELLLQIELLDSHPTRLEFFRMVELGQVSRSQFVEEMVRLDRGAVASLASFVRDRWLPWAAKSDSFSIPTVTFNARFDPETSNWIPGGASRVEEFEQLYDAITEISSLAKTLIGGADDGNLEFSEMQNDPRVGAFRDSELALLIEETIWRLRFATMNTNEVE